MAKQERKYEIPTKCARCGNEELRRLELSMYGKLGFMGPDYRFDVYVCRDCGYAELFFQSAKWIK
jgi:predicted nucleic-acid-binding Zn-ribbon protein